MRQPLLLIMVLIITTSCMYSSALHGQDAAAVTESKTQSSESFLDYTEPAALPAPNPMVLLGRVVVSLLLIIVCIVAVVFAIKWITKDKNALFQKKERYFQVVDRLHLDQKRGIYLIKLLDEILVVGGTPEQLNLLSKVTDSEKVEALSSREFLPLFNLMNKPETELVRGDAQ